MSITSLGFLLFIVAGLFIYYLLPHKYKWVFLLVMSFIFYSVSDIRNVIFILAFTCSSYFYSKIIESKLCKNTIQMRGGTGKSLSAKSIVIFAIITDVLILFLVKYLPEILPFNYSIQQHSKFLKYFMPIGISYYTLMSISYVLDVYWEKTKAEHNFFKLMLFTGYFPLLVQGPISKWGQLSQEFFKEHKFNFINIKFGAQLMLWGFFKKLIISDRCGLWVNGMMSSSHELPYGAEAVLVLIFYAIQLYADFSGGIDIIRGVSECFDVKITENFRQPYFSKSLGEFWRRWHISLGAWMKDYIFYPIALSKTCSRFKKSLKKHGFNSKIANQLSFAFADLVVFFLVGLWHGAASKFILWGMYNGIILAFSELMKEVYIKQKKLLHINESSILWNGFCIFRTILIVLVGYCFDITANGGQAVELFCNIFTSGPSVWQYASITKSGILLVAFSSLILLVVDILNDKGMSIRDKLNKKNYFIQVLVWSFILQLLFLFGKVSSDGGFMYANF